MYFGCGRLLMSPILSSVTALSLLAHCVLGCCWHHAHACEDAGRHVAVEDFQGGHCHPDEWTGSCLDSQDLCQATHAGHEDCRGARCVFVGALRMWPVSGHSQTLGHTSTADAARVDTAACGRLPGQTILTATAGLLPLRIHLLYQILLI